MRRIFLSTVFVAASGAVLVAIVFYNLQTAKVVKIEAPLAKIELEQPVVPDVADVADSSKNVSIFSVGDIMLGRNVEGKMNEKGLGYPFEKIKPYFVGADIVIGNLEGPIRKEHSRTPTGSTTFNFRTEVAGELQRAGFTTLSLANNHTLDYGTKGFEETQRYLKEAGVEFFGHQRNIEDAFILRKEINGYKFAFIGLQDVFASMDSSQAITLVKTVAAEPDTTTIVSIHWGDEYKLTNNKRQQTLAHDFIDAGADLIIGHHPHVVQNIEEYNDKLIFYSLGNFIFDQYFSRETQEGLMLSINFGEQDLTVQLYPVGIINSQPTPMEESVAKIWLQKLAERSDPILSTQIINGIIA